MDWTTFFSQLGVSGILLGAVGWLIRFAFARASERDLERYKAELDLEAREFQSRLEAAAIQHRSSLELLSTEHRIRFEKLHLERGQAILDIWRAMVLARTAAHSFTSSFQSHGKDGQDKKAELVNERIVNLARLLQQNLIFFPKSLSDDLRSFVNDFDGLLFIATDEYQEARSNGTNPYYDENGRSVFGKANAKMQSEIDPVIERLECHFRDLLGVEPMGKAAGAGGHDRATDPSSVSACERRPR